MATEIEEIGIAPPAGIAPRGTDAVALVRKLQAVRPKWELGARGPRAFDCWSMKQLVQFHLFGRVLSVVNLDADADAAAVARAVATHEANAQWRLREGEPQHGDGVKMGHIRAPFHVGTWLAIDRGFVLHHDEHEGLCCDTLAALRAKGFRHIRFHEFRGETR